MPTCVHCGGEIVFRRVGGVTTPIHLDGSCWKTAVPQNFATEIRFEHTHDLCRRARCPKCSATVFFIRHNGGSVWVDDLGWPWPKHPCFDQATDCPSPLQILVGKTLQFPGAVGAVVTWVAFIPAVPGCTAVITTPEAGSEQWIVSGIQDPRQLLGALVMLSADREMLIHADLGTFPISRRCPVCSAELSKRDFEVHMATCHGAVRCPRCHALVNRAAWEAHLSEHQRDNRSRQKPRPRARPQAGGLNPEPVPTGIQGQPCPRGHGPLRSWEGVPRCWTCGWPFKQSP
jgi:uncharacterized protein with PIN domain